MLGLVPQEDGTLFHLGDRDSLGDSCFNGGGSPPNLAEPEFFLPAIQEHPMASQPNGPHAIDNQGSESLNLSDTELDIAMDMIAQIVPHLDLQDCHKVAELAEAQAAMLEIMNARQTASPAAIQHHFAA